MNYRADPELVAISHLLPRADLADLEATRALEHQVLGQAPGYESRRRLETIDLTIEGLDGAPSVTVRLFRAADAPRPLPALVYLHPGAFVLGSLASSQSTARRLADELDLAVLVVDYRLAPEHPYPAAVDDSYAVLRWAGTEAAREHDLDPARVAVLGDSAGGGLAAAVTARSVDDRAGTPTALFLDAPTLDDRLTSASMAQFTDTPMWRSPDSPISWAHYLGDLVPGSDDVPVYAAPARADVDQLTGFPPTWLAAYQLDPTRDEGLTFARRLIEAGVPTELRHYAGAFHMTHMIPGTAIGARIYAGKLAAIRRMFALRIAAGRASCRPQR